MPKFWAIPQAKCNQMSEPLNKSAGSEPCSAHTKRQWARQGPKRPTERVSRGAPYQRQWQCCRVTDGRYFAARQTLGFWFTREPLRLRRW